MDDEEPKPAGGDAQRHGHWNVYGTAGAVSAVIMTGFIASVFPGIGRWIVHITGVWPL